MTATNWGWGSQSIHDDDPERDRKMHDRLTGRERGLQSMGGPYGFAQFDLAPAWWRDRQIKAAKAIATKHGRRPEGPPATRLHPNVWQHLKNNT